MADRRATAATAPSPASPIPPANRGLLNRASSGRKEVETVEVVDDGLDIVWRDEHRVKNVHFTMTPMRSERKLAVAASPVLSSRSNKHFHISYHTGLT